METHTNSAISEARQRELKEKDQRIQAFIQKNNLDGLVLNTQGFFAWATAGGSNWVATDGEGGVATLLYLAGGQKFAFINNLEVPRFRDEELLYALGYKIVSQDWWQSDAVKEAAIWEMAGGKNKRLGADFNLNDARRIAGELSRERWQLTPDEADRYRSVGADAASALENTCSNLTPGMTEWEIAGQLVKASYERGLLAFVTLVATDERVYNYRHPIPTFKKLEKYAMVVLCAKRGGLIANCTRFVHFGPLPAELQRKQEAVLQIDATFNLNTLPGAKVNEIFGKAQAAYAQTGFPDEWTLHHQGGATGYGGRDYLGSPENQEVVLDNQAFAWNPSITGIKVEDTILVSAAHGHEILTKSAKSTWPTRKVEIPGLGTLERPVVLER